MHARRLFAAAVVSTFTAASLVHAAGQADPEAMPTPEQIAAMRAAAEGAGAANGKNDKPEFPPFEEVTKDFERVDSTGSGSTMYDLYVNRKTNQMLAVLPPNFERQNLFIGTTFSGGMPTAGIQYGDLYAKWQRFDKRLALIQPNLETRSTGDAESQASRNALFTDTVLFDTPIVTMSPKGGPVIDLDAILVNGADKFFGAMVRGSQSQLASIGKAKAFEENIEVEYKIPARDGRILGLHYSISVLPENTGYKPRKADQRVGYFTTTYLDLGDPATDQPYTRYINRWKLEKADPSLKMSPPKEPIVFYIEHTTPIRYRRWVREGVLEWNKAFEEVGIINAVEVYQQDARSGAHMDKDPENVKYNFIRWNANGASFAIGPSRVDPRTGQILDADVVMNDGWIRAYAFQFQRLLPDIATEGFAPETLAWLDERPQWDPRVAFAAPAERDRIVAMRNAQRAAGAMPAFGGHAAANIDTRLMGDDAFDGFGPDRISQMNGRCMHGAFKSMDLGMVRLGLDTLDAFILAEGSDSQMIDGVPEDFIGPLLKDVIIHEVGHVLGLRHNFVASSLMGIEEMNTEEMRGKPQTASVMDYNPININYGDGPVQGDWTMLTVGPYDTWAIRYGYADDKEIKDILAESGERAHRFMTDEDTWGPDPLARRYDFGSDPLKWAESRMRLVQDLRTKLIDRAVKDGDEWQKVRDYYQTLLGQHFTAVGVAANWVGGSHVTRTVKNGDTDETPIRDVDPNYQRKALQFVVDNAFRDEAFGLNSDLLYRMTLTKWYDQGGFSTLFTDPTYSVHDTIASLQTSALTQVMNPTTLRRVLDNEFRVPSDQDAVTLPEVFATISKAVWTELEKPAGRGYTDRQPMVSSLRRNLQRQHIDRLIDLSRPTTTFGASGKPVANLAVYHLNQVREKIDGALKTRGIDTYTAAHLSDAKNRIDQALDATYISNINDIRVNLTMPGMPFGQPAEQN